MNVLDLIGFVERTFYSHNGSVLELASLPYRDSVTGYQGAEYGVIAFEEVTEFWSRDSTS